MAVESKHRPEDKHFLIGLNSIPSSTVMQLKVCLLVVFVYIICLNVGLRLLFGSSLGRLNMELVGMSLGKLCVNTR